MSYEQFGLRDGQRVHSCWGRPAGDCQHTYVDPDDPECTGCPWSKRMVGLRRGEEHRRRWWTDALTDIQRSWAERQKAPWSGRV